MRRVRTIAYAASNGISDTPKYLLEADSGQVVRHDRRVVDHARHRLTPAVPVHVEPVRIERMLPRMLCRPEVQRIVDVKRLGEERHKAGEAEQVDRDQPAVASEEALVVVVHVRMGARAGRKHHPPLTSRAGETGRRVRVS
jgi:hypothetical protein